MGLQIRKRTKGKGGWLNFSYSKKKGIGASLSVKVGKNITYNTRGRTTVNLGNGVRYVSYRKKKKETTDEHQSVSSNRTSKEVYVSYTTDELLDSAQRELIKLGNYPYFKTDRDYEYLVDVYNAIEYLRENPTLDARDIIVITTTLLTEFAEKTNDTLFISRINGLTMSLKTLAPQRPKPPERYPTGIVILFWGTILGLCGLITMCSL